MAYCRTLTELVTDYLEDRLSTGDRLRFQLHLGICRHCRAYLNQLKLTMKTLGKLPPEPMPEAVKSELLARFRGWARE